MPQTIATSAILRNPQAFGLSFAMVASMGCLLDAPAQSVVEFTWIAKTKDKTTGEEVLSWSRIDKRTTTIDGRSVTEQAIGQVVEQMIRKALANMTMALPQQVAESAFSLTDLSNWDKQSGSEWLSRHAAEALPHIVDHADAFRESIEMGQLRACFSTA